jgi:nitroreductase/NAD-dependent dihydropyrimidine dehydrogenase PreA subunit
MPVIDLNHCTRCLKCVKDCPANAIRIETGKIVDTCIHCGHCIAICPEMTVFPDKGEIIPLRPHSVTAEDFSLFTAGVRSCRNYQSKEVPESILMQLVANLKHAPSASNARPLRISIVNSAEKVQLLNDLTTNSLIKLLSLVTSPFVSPFIKLFAPKMDIQKLKRYKKSFVKKQKENNSMICHHAPAVLIFHGPVTKAGMLEADANIWATYTSLHANAMGLGTCFIGFIVKAFGKNGKQNHNFGIPATNRIYAALIVGYPKVKYKQECSRESPEVTWV